MNILKTLFVYSLLLISLPASSEADWLSPDGMTQVMPGVDDGTFQVEMGHSFPYYGGVFTNAWMSSNGVIILYDPTTGTGNPRTWDSMCCSGRDFYNQPLDQFSYMIAPAMADFRDPDGSGPSGYYYQTDKNSTSFLWYEIVEYGTANSNTFQADLFSDGSLQFLYDELNVTRRNVFIGNTGDMSDNTDTEVNQLYYGYGAIDNQLPFAQENPGYGFAWSSTGEFASTGPDCSDPLADPSCPGYDDAYYSQQCSANALYDPGCPGYEQAYYQQQCNNDAMYDQNCPGYVEAYYDQQCAADATYDSYCPGYEQAYYDQQCNNDAMYDQNCPGYADAYYDQQCNNDATYDQNCPGYEQAYYQQQCSADSLYDPGCPGYGEAYQTQQCNANTLYSPECPGYEEAYLAQQCEYNPAYDSSCPGFSDVQATPNLVTDAEAERTESFAIGIAIQEALRHSGAGITVYGVDYSFDYRLGVNSSIDLGVSVEYADNNATGYPSQEIIGEYYLDTPTDGYDSFSDKNLSSMGIPMTELLQFNMDFGLQGDAAVKDISAQMLFTGDMCTENPLYSTTCPEYESAYLAQQCDSIGPLYDSQCPGYEEAFYAQQCGLDALYDTQCPGYEVAYFEQQCESNTLYDSACPGYEEAYFDQQCGLDTLYDQLCPGYAEAYFDQQCSNDTLYDQLCPGYEEAYLSQQCGLDTLYDTQCPGYEEAFYAQQCGLDSLYSEQCPGYEEAFYAQQCSLDALYDTQCPGYEEAFYAQQCGLDALYDTQCPGYEEAFYAQQCGLDALYDTQCPGYEVAYFDQQCELDTLYDKNCPGYTDAVAELQLSASCTADPLYSTECPGYTTAKQLADMEEQASVQQPSSTGMPSNDNGSMPTIVTEPEVATFEEPAQTTGEPAAEVVEPVVEVVEVIEEPVVEVIEEPVAEVAEVAEVIEEPVAEVAEVVEETAVEEEAVAKVEKRKPKVDVMSIVSDVLSAERDLVESNVLATQNTSIAQSQAMSSSSSGSSSSGTTASSSSGSSSSLFEMDTTQTTALADTQNSTLQQSSSFGGSSSFAGGASNDSTTTAGSQTLGDSLAAGGSISQTLSNPGSAPGSNIKPPRPSASQQQATAKAESLAERMSESELEEIAERRAESQDEDEYGDQTFDVVIMNSGTNIGEYYRAMELQRQNQQAQWYIGKDIYKNNKPRDNLGVFYSTAGKSEKLLREIIQQQYEEQK